MSGETILGWAVVGGVALVGMWAAHGSVRSAAGPRERRFVRRVCATIWTLAVAGTAGIVWLPGALRWISAIAMVITIPSLLYRWTMQRQLIRQLDRRELKESESK